MTTRARQTARGGPGGGNGQKIAVEPRNHRFGGFSSELEWRLLNRMAIAGLPGPVSQFRFCPTRRWRADFAYPAAMLLIEVDGGTWTHGRHVRGKGFEADCEKTSTAAALGFRVIRVTREMVEDGRAVALIRQALGVLEPAAPAHGRDE